MLLGSPLKKQAGTGSELRIMISVHHEGTKTSSIRSMSFEIQGRPVPLLLPCRITPFTENTMTAMSADRTMIKIAMSAPYLAREEERDLAVRWKDSQDQDARNQI